MFVELYAVYLSALVNRKRCLTHNSPSNRTHLACLLRRIAVYLVRGNTEPTLNLHAALSGCMPGQIPGVIVKRPGGSIGLCYRERKRAIALAASSPAPPPLCAWVRRSARVP